MFNIKLIKKLDTLIFFFSSPEMKTQYYLITGIKKGIVEVADLVVVNKCDGDLVNAAQIIQSEYISALKFIRKMNPLWSPQVIFIGLPQFGIYSTFLRCLFRKMCSTISTFKQANILYRY